MCKSCNGSINQSNQISVIFFFKGFCSESLNVNNFFFLSGKEKCAPMMQLERSGSSPKQVPMHTNLVINFQYDT